MIKKEDNQYFVYNKEGTKKLSKGYATHEEAVKRLQQIEYFKMNDHAIEFNDTIVIGEDNREAISMRDGVHEYLGLELGLDEPKRMYTIYRSPQTIKETVDKLVGIPVTDDHIDNLDKPVPENKKRGKVETSEIIEQRDNTKDATIAVKNTLNLDNSMLDKVNDGKRELSLGYTGNLIPHDSYDFEQIITKCHHLAIVQKARCGNTCSFQDNDKGETMLIKDGKVDMDAMDAFMKDMPKALDMMGEEDKKKMMDKFGKMMPKAQSKDAEMDEKKKKEMEDAMKEKEKSYKDSIPSIQADAVKDFLDSDKYQELMINFATERVKVIDKAKTFLDSEYSFDGKSNLNIMADVLRAEKPTESFASNEVAVAFKMLNAKKENPYKDFKDHRAESTSFASMADEEL